tara:strand:- start:1273 stop:2268 length:996 start_codon:yes stop_codon:yes gene_type:complete
MIIKYFDLKKNLKSNINYYLLYGPNVGLIEETIQNTLKPVFSKNLFNYDESEILLDENSFKEKILNKSFFENEKLIIINRTSDKIFKLIKEIIDYKVTDIKIVLKSGPLDKKSKIRAYFEKNLDTCIVPFYEDNYQSLFFLTQEFFKKRDIKTSSQNINVIIEKSKGNRMSLKNDLEKIAIFCNEKKTINLDEILKITNTDENHNISELTDQCLAKNQKKTFSILNENISSIEDNILIIRNFLYKLKRLKQLKERLEIQKNSDLVLSSFKPPIFWKDKEIIKKQLNLWSLDEIQKLIIKICEIENLVKNNSQISNLIINNFIIESLQVTNN